MLVASKFRSISNHKGGDNDPLCHAFAKWSATESEGIHGNIRF